MPKLIVFLILHAGVGFVLALLSVAAILAFDVAGLGGLTRRSEFGGLGVVLLVVGLAGLLGTVQIAIALALEAEKGDAPPDAER